MTNCWRMKLANIFDKRLFDIDIDIDIVLISLKPVSLRL